VIAEKALAMLTERERQIANLASAGLSNKEVGQRLNLTAETIKVHLHNVYQKLEIINRTTLTPLAVSDQYNPMWPPPLEALCICRGRTRAGPLDRASRNSRHR
jgi:DNA-binding CsgD family transcriptional regulator